MLKLSACIVVYRGAEEALAAAASVLQFTKRYPLTLYLVDNASPDDSAAVLRNAVENELKPAENQEIRLICAEQNRGFGSGHNLVLPELDSDYHFILNPDILLRSDTLSDMADWMQQHPDCVMSRPNLIFPSGAHQPLPLRKCSACALVYRQLPFLKPLKRFNDAYLMADKDLSVPTKIQFCTGSFSAVRTADFRAVGGFDETYFMYVEDADLTQKMLRQGTVYLLPQFTAVHAWHRAPHKNGSAFKMQLKSMCLYYKKWGFQL